MASIVCRAWWLGFHIKLSAWVLRCSFYCAGQCESLKVWNVRQVRISTLFLCMPASSELISTNAETGRSIGKQNSNAMQTNYLKCLCLILLILAAGTTDAQDFEVNGIYYNVLSEEEGTVEVTRGYYSGDVVIPAEVSHDGGTYRVTTIGDYAFQSCSSLTSVSMPSVTTIGDDAFGNCDGLTSVEMPSVTTIGDYAFYYCSALTSVSMPSVVTIGEDAFYTCSSLTSVSMPSATTIGDDAFEYCSTLTSVEMPAVATIGEYAFYGCSALTSIYLPASCTSIDGNPFSGCDALKEIVVDEDNPNFSSHDGVLYDKNVETLLACPGSKSSIDTPSSVTTIGDCAFYGCSALTSVSMPEVTRIGEGAFYSCSALTSIYLPASCTSIDGNPFSGCDALKEIVVDEDNPNFSSHDGVLYDKNVETLLACPGSKSSIDTPSSVTTIGDEAFGACSALTSVEMPEVTTIGDYAFNFCSSLTSISMPSVTTIGGYAFYECSSLTSISMPEVKTIGDSAFEYCSALTSLSMPSVTTIGYGAFYYCSALTSVDIPASVSMIGNDAFSLCNALTSVYCRWEEPLECDPSFVDKVLENATLYVPTGTVYAYRSVSPWSEFLNIEEKDYSGIADATAPEVVIKVIDGAIVIEGGDMAVSASVVEVYSAGGVCVYRGTDSSIGGLGRGVYVVKVGGTVQKVAL